MCSGVGGTPVARAQIEMGHKVLGAVGIDAGTQPPPGLYLGARSVVFGSHEVRDRNGEIIPLPGLDIDVWAGALGAAYVIKPGKAPYFTFAFSAPVARMSLSIDDPRVAVDRAGFADIYVLPLHAGWRSDRFDAVMSYGLYVPSGHFEPRGSGGVGRGYWTQQLSLGGAAFFSEDRRRRASVLVSYDVNSRKRGIDITRGSTVQAQGGAGLGLGKSMSVGIAAYALRQVTSDKGTDIPPVLRGHSDRVYGLGPEAQLQLPIGLLVELRAMWDFGARSRAVGNVIVGGLMYRL